MTEFFPVLSRCALFAGIRQEDFSPMLGCLGARVVEATKQQFIFHEGAPASQLGIVLAGSVQTVTEDFYGNRSILFRSGAGELFGESFACAGVSTLPVSIVAAEDSRFLLVDSRRITVSCSNACAFHSRMIYNLLQVVAAKNLEYQQKLTILSQRSTREKLMTYLLAQAKQHGSNSFVISYDRQGLADYLGVERSAMSAELSKLRRDGFIEYERSRFHLCKSS